MLQSSLASALDHRAIGDRIAEWDAQFDHIRASRNRRENDLACSRQVGIATGNVDDQRRLVVESQRHEKFAIADYRFLIGNRLTALGFSINNQQSETRQSILRFSRKIPTSLSPRPEMFTIMTSLCFIFGARLITSATACADSSAGMIPSVRASRVVASSVSASVAATYSARLVSCSHACSGPIEG